MWDHDFTAQKMDEALELALEAVVHDDVPVGALVLSPHGAVIGRGKNERELRQSSVAHAEWLAIQDASATLKGWNLSGCTMVVTLEPCLMCVGAILQSRISHLVFGATDPKAGAVVSTIAVGARNLFPYKFTFRGGVREERAASFLREFFQAKRQAHRIDAR
jgi:tRNA(adenine34) deaminase